MILFFNQISISDISKVGGKNASLGEMYNQLNPKGISIPNGFALTADAYRLFLKQNDIKKKLSELLLSLDTENYSNLSTVGEAARALILSGKFSDEIIDPVRNAYKKLSSDINDLGVAVRSSATAEDLPTASFAGRMESFLNISGEEQLLKAIQRCYASLYTDRAIKYRYDMGYASIEVYISVGIQQMIRSDQASSGVAFTIDPDSGFENCVVINSSWGLGENIVQGRVTPDEWMIFKPSLFNEKLNPILKTHCGKKEYTMLYSKKSEPGSIDSSVINVETEQVKQQKLSLTNSEVIQLARWCYKIEEYYGKAMDIEWAKDGLNGGLYIVQARPETVHGKEGEKTRKIFSIKEKGRLLAKGTALGKGIATGKVRILFDPKDSDQLQKGEILITDITNPDWDPILKKAAAILTNKGGRTSHAAIVARELGTVAVVGCENVTEILKNGQEITVSCAEGEQGYIYEGILEIDIREQDYSKLPMPKIAPMLILSDAQRAFELRNYPNQGVGLLRLEFAISNSIRIHPLALCEPEKIKDEAIKIEIEELVKDFSDSKSYFINKLAQEVSRVAAAFYPKKVIVRMSDFKSNEYANLIGGKYFEPNEENPMLGLRGASRYYSDFYREGFALECRAMKKVREEFGMENVKLMIPFCRTVEEGEKVLAEMSANGLRKGEKGLEVYVMIEIPSNVLLADKFAKLFDGFSIGSNDLTQLTLGLDRDSELVSSLFNEENPAVKILIEKTILAAKENNIKVGLCGQAPSDIPAFTKFLVEKGIDSISFNPDALIRGIENILIAEAK